MKSLSSVQSKNKILMGLIFLFGYSFNELECLYLYIMDKSNRIIMRMLLDRHYKSDRQKREIIKLFTGRNVAPESIEAFKKYLLQFFK